MSDGLPGLESRFIPRAVGNKIPLASVVQEPVGWELGCLCINAPSYMSYFKPVPLGLEKKVIIKVNAKRCLGLLRGDCTAASQGSSPGTQSLCFRLPLSQLTFWSFSKRTKQNKAGAESR